MTIDKGTPLSVEFPVPYLEVRDRESVPVLSGLVLYVPACDPLRSGTPALQLLDWRRCRIAALFGQTASDLTPPCRRSRASHRRMHCIQMVILKGLTLASVQVVDAKSNVKPEYRNCGEGEDPN